MDGFNKKLPFDRAALERINALFGADQMHFSKQVIGAVLAVKKFPIRDCKSAINSLTADQVLENIADRVHPDALLMTDIRQVLREVYDECEDLILNGIYPEILPVSPLAPEPF